MSFSSFIKKHKIAVIVTSVLVPVCVIGFIVFISILPHDTDISREEAIAIAKNDFGCEKVLWIDTYGAYLSLKAGDEKTPDNLRSHFSYYVVGEKAGKEIYIIIPSDPTLEKPFVSTWSLDYTFKQVVEKFNELGANYVVEVPDNYNSVERDYIKIAAGGTLNIITQSFDTGGTYEEFYDRLDIKAVFYYQWQDGEYIHGCIVAQENGELKSYENVIEA